MKKMLAEWKAGMMSQIEAIAKERDEATCMSKCSTEEKVKLECIVMECLMEWVENEKRLQQLNRELLEMQSRSESERKAMEEEIQNLEKKKISFWPGLLAVASLAAVGAMCLV